MELQDRVQELERQVKILMGKSSENESPKKNKKN